MLIVAAILVVAQQLGIFQQLADPPAMRAALVELGGWGYFAFIAAYALLQPFGFPATVFTLSAPLVWPWPVAFALSLTGAMAASVIGFLFARFVARDFVARRIPRRFRRYDEALGRRAFVTVLLMRMAFLMSSPLHAFFGVSKVGFWTHLWGSLVAYVVPLFLVSLYGERIFEVASEAPRELWIGLGVGVVVVGLGVWIVRRRQRARDEHETAQEE